MNPERNQAPLPEHLRTLGDPLLNCNNVWPSPHTAGLMQDTEYNGARFVAANLRAIVQGVESTHYIE